MHRRKLGIIFLAAFLVSSTAVAARGIKVEAGGPVYGPSATTPGKLAVNWAFSLSLPEKTRYESVIVEEVSTTEPRLIVLQKRPDPQMLTAPDRLRLYMLQLRGEPIDVSPESTPWVYKDDTTTFMFRFTLKPVGEREVRHEQPVIVDQLAKAQMRQMAEELAAKKAGVQ